MTLSLEDTDRKPYVSCEEEVGSFGGRGTSYREIVVVEDMEIMCCVCGVGRRIDSPSCLLWCTRQPRKLGSCWHNRSV